MTSCLNGLALEGETVREMRRKMKKLERRIPSFLCFRQPIFALAFFLTGSWVHKRVLERRFT